MQLLPRGRPTQPSAEPWTPLSRIPGPQAAQLVDRRRRHEHVELTGSSLHTLAKLLQTLVTIRV
jgi:hypothetical protein